MADDLDAFLAELSSGGAAAAAAPATSKRGGTTAAKQPRARVSVAAVGGRGASVDEEDGGGGGGGGGAGGSGRPPCWTVRGLGDPAPLTRLERADSWTTALRVEVSRMHGEEGPPTPSTPVGAAECPEGLRAFAEQLLSLPPSMAPPQVVEECLARMSDLWGGFAPLAFEPVDKVTPRTQSLFRCLVAFHDPVLVSHLASACVTSWFQLGELFGVYVRVARLLDLAVLSGVTGFDTPQLGSYYFALGVMVSQRERLLGVSTDDEVKSILSETVTQCCAATTVATSTTPVAELAIAVGSRAAQATPAYFARVLGEVEMTSLMDYVHRAGDYLAMTRQAKARAAAGGKVAGGPAALPGNNKTTTTTWWSSVVNNLVPASAPPPSSTPAKPSAPANKKPAAAAAASALPSTPTMSQLLTRAVPPAAAATPAAAAAAAGATANVPRRLYLVEYKGARRLGLKLVAGADGLAVKSFDRGSNDNDSMGEAEAEGTVQVGDLVHAVNGVSVILLSSKMAGKVIQAQDRPLHVIFSTPARAGRQPALKLSEELQREQKTLLRSRLYSFYGRHGGSDKQGRVDDLLRLFAGREDGFLRALANKYGEKVPGDPTMSPILVQADAREVVDSIIPSGGKSLSLAFDSSAVFVDVRSVDERHDTGTFENSFLIGPDELNDPKHVEVLTAHIATLRHRVKVHLMPSGRSRLSWMTDPAKARADQDAEDAFVLRVAEALWARRVFHVDVIQGGFVAVYREMKARLSGGAVPLEGCRRGYVWRGCEAFAKVDFEDAKSVTTFLVGYYEEFRDPSVVVGGSGSGAGGVVVGGAGLSAALGGSKAPMIQRVSSGEKKKESPVPSPGSSSSMASRSGTPPMPVVGKGSASAAASGGSGSSSVSASAATVKVKKAEGARAPPVPVPVPAPPPPPRTAAPAPPAAVVEDDAFSIE